MSRAAAESGTLPSVGVAAPADKRFRRPDVRPGKRGRLGSIRRRVVRLVIFTVILGGVGLEASVLVLKTRALSIDRVVFHGNHRLSDGEVQALVTGLRGEGILGANLEKYRARLLDSPWVADARLRRVLPSTVEVTITERVPMAAARLGQQLYLVDGDGVIIDEYGSQYAEFDLPVVDGLASAPAGGQTLIDERRARFAGTVLDAATTRSTLKVRISQLDVSDVHDAVVVLEGDPTLLHLGDTQFAERLQRYLEMAPTLRDKFGDLDYVDLRFGDHIPLRPAHAPPVVKK